jgi:uncharacterized membrane protein
MLAGRMASTATQHPTSAAIEPRGGCGATASGGLPARAIAAPRVPARSVVERIAQTLAFEAIGWVVVTPAYRAVTDAALFDSLTLMLAVSIVAALWCVAFDALFEWVESCSVRRMASRRPHHVSLLQATMREATVIPMTLPVIYMLTGMSLQDALMTDIALAVVYVVYGYLFFLVVDQPRGLTAPRQGFALRP